MSDITAVGYEGFSFLKVQNTQPEVINPKTGKPYDLKDPEFPVVDDPNHKFRVQYWQMTKTVQSYLLQYLEERWVYFNKTRFGGRLSKPEIVLLKDVNAVRMRLRGLWTSNPDKPPGKLSVSPNLFNAPHEGWVNRTLIHEMCHQEEFETFGSIQRLQKGHGPRWQAFMRKAGLHPLQYDTEANETYADRHEKIQFQEIQEKSKPFLQAYEVLKATRSPIKGKPTIGEHVLFATSQGIIYGKVISKATKAGFWYVEEDRNVLVFRWGLKPVGMFTPSFKDTQAKRYEA